jgi:hypothetical protein
MEDTGFLQQLYSDRAEKIELKNFDSAVAEQFAHETVKRAGAFGVEHWCVPGQSAGVERRKSGSDPLHASDGSVSEVPHGRAHQDYAALHRLPHELVARSSKPLILSRYSQ